MTEHLEDHSDVHLRVLGNQSQHDETIPKLGAPWTEYAYDLFDWGTTPQQMRWYALRWPKAEAYWPDLDLMYCTAESYVPVRRARLAVTVHDAAFFEPNRRAHTGTWKQRFKWTLLYRRLAKEADLFHTVSSFSAERIAHYFPSIRDRLTVVHNAVAPHFFDPAPEEGRLYLREHGMGDRPFVMLPRGLHYRKNADLVLKAWPRIHEAVPNAKLVVTSHNDPEYVNKAKERFGDSVHITGFLSEEVLHAIYEAATLVWMPSRYEGFGLPVLEAMACDTAVVASDASALPEVAGNAAELVPVDNPGAHISVLRSLLETPSQRERLREAGRKRAQQFTWDRSATQLLSAFQDIV
ncbi:glycosyltransferase involved in cell wall biosynthesis [Salinibacter ruber]|nr:glycosyltransferase involved in cell wall biosynthesis [Salinibacter ruber]